MDRSLKTKGSLARHRNVLKRSERIKILEDQEKFKPGDESPFGLQKVAHRKASVGTKTKKKTQEEGPVEGEGEAKVEEPTAK